METATVLIEVDFSRVRKMSCANCGQPFEKHFQPPADADPKLADNWYLSNARNLRVESKSLAVLDGGKEAIMEAITDLLDEIFTSEEQDLLRDGLNALLGLKKTAFEEIEIARMTDHPMVAGARPFKAEDFGIPKIEALLNRLNAE